MRLREILPHANFVASATALNSAGLCRAAEYARQCQVNIQRGGVDWTQDDLHNETSHDNFVDWRDHILALMLLRDCIGREMVRRGLTPPGPPMLARDWESGGMYLCVRSRDIPMPPWLEQMGRKQLAEAVVPAYDRGLCIGQEIDDE